MPVALEEGGLVVVKPPLAAAELESWTCRTLLVQEVRAGSKKLVMVLICVPPSCSASVRQSRAATAGMRAARLTRRPAAGNRFSACQPVAAAIVRACSPVITLALSAPVAGLMAYWAMVAPSR